MNNLDYLSIPGVSEHGGGVEQLLDPPNNIMQRENIDC